MEEIKKRIITCYNQISNFNIDINTSLSSNLKEELGMTSILFVYLIFELEKEFDIQINDINYDDLETLKDLIELFS